MVGHSNKVGHTGDFGKLAEAYDAFRPKYPQRVITTVLDATKSKEPFLLDLGCGTGISTRQLAGDDRFIVGCDFDEAMLQVAIKKGGKNIAYTVGDANKLPFADDTFDALTMFTAFHWFTNKAAVKEMRRVLKSNGVVCAVQPRHTAVFRSDFRKLVEEELQTTIPRIYSQTPFKTFLAQQGFKKVEQYSMKTSTTYALDRFLQLVESYSIWNFVPEKRKPIMRRRFKKHFSQFAKNGKIKDTRDIEITVASN